MSSYARLFFPNRSYIRKSLSTDLATVSIESAKFEMVNIATLVYNETLEICSSEDIGLFLMRHWSNSSVDYDPPVTNVNYSLTLPVDLQSNFKDQKFNNHKIKINCANGSIIMVSRYFFDKYYIN